MTYSLNTLNSSAPLVSPIRIGINRFAREIALILGLLALVFWCMALLGFSLQDAAWSTSGQSEVVHNWGGRLGAWIADMSYFCLGFSVWWCLAAGARMWLAGLADWMRAHAPEDKPRPSGHIAGTAWGFWLGMFLLLCASSALEWSRLYRLAPALSGHVGGVLGYLMGPFGMKWLGFTGSGLVWIALGVIGVSAVFRFSWSHVAERLGAWAYAMVETRREKRVVAEDLAVGKVAAKKREAVVREERVEITANHPTPVLI